MNEGTLNRALRNLARRQLALKDTLDEITWLDGQKPSPERNAAIAAAFTKRDRQNNAVKAAEYIIGLTKKGK